jgi:tRNA(Phe) wybutosine-synthesizing methylase Tyw3
LSAVDKRFLVSVRCSIRLEVPLWDSRASTAAKILVDQDYVRFLLDSANRKFAANELRICNFHRAFRAEFFDASTLRTLPPISVAGVVDVNDDVLLNLFLVHFLGFSKFIIISVLG